MEPTERIPSEFAFLMVFVYQKIFNYNFMQSSLTNINDVTETDATFQALNANKNQHKTLNCEKQLPL
jgi:hypothetical protein